MLLKSYSHWTKSIGLLLVNREQRVSPTGWILRGNKVSLPTVCHHNLHYSINEDLGGLLIKISKAKPHHDLAEFELMRYLDCGFLSRLPQGLCDYPKLWSTSVSINFNLTLSRQARIQQTPWSHIVQLLLWVNSEFG